MAGGYAYIPAIWPPLAAAIFLAAIGLYAWRRRDVPGGKPFVAMSAVSILILLGIACEAAAVAPATRVAWYKFQFVMLIAAVTPVTCFVLDYAYPGRWLTRRNLILLSIPALLCLLAAVINDSQLIWRRLEVGADGVVVASYALAGAMLVAYGVGMFLLYVAVFLWLFIRSPQHRWPVALMLLGQISSRAAFLLDLAHPAASFYLDLSVVVVVLPWTTYAIAMFGFHILDPLPAARRTAFEQMQAGVVVFDAGWHVVSLNLAAEEFLGVRTRVARGKTWQQLAASQVRLPALPDTSTLNAGGPTELPEITSGSDLDALYYEPALSPLRDFRGLLMGYLLVLRDMTEHRQAEAALRESVEKQRIIFEHAFDGIAIYEEYPDTGTRRLLECNERYAELSGRSRQELLEMGDPALVQKPLALAPYARPRREIEAAQSAGFFSWVRPDGKENIIEYSAATIRAGGRLLTVGLDRDVTEREQAEARLLQQQQTLAVLQERERLARELHDDLGQVLAYVKMQAQAAREQLARDQYATADEYLAQLIRVAQDAHTDVREYILGTRTTTGSHLEFLPALKAYLEQFAANYGIRTELVVAPALSSDAFGPMVQAQLLRIIQEALANARKHGHAHCVQVRFQREGGRAQVIVQDDGAGFDLESQGISEGGHFGLRFMQERAQEVDGSVAVTSSPSQGTRVEVEVPLGQGRGEEEKRK
jgi:PAS domain S-box-containing protein